MTPRSKAPVTAPMFLLGAGASVEAGVPASFDMTRKLVEGMPSGYADRWNLGKALNFITGALVAYDSAEGISPYTGLDVERVFAAVELLAERRELEVSPFVASWHPAVDEWDRPELPHFWDRKLQRELLRESPFDSARDVLVDLIEAVTRGGTGDIYTKLAERMIHGLHRQVLVTPKSAAYLRPLAALGRKRGGVTVATLNYDRSVELACAEVGVRMTTGIDAWSSDRAWKWPPRGVRLLKLHGSIDWKWETTDPETGHFPISVVRQATDEELEVARGGDRVVNPWEPALVFGQRGKLRAAGPFLSLLAEFESQLELTDHLIVIGYSFRDDHVNEIISRWTVEGLERRITIVDKEFPERPHRVSDYGFRDRLTHHLNPGSPDGAPGLQRVTLKEMPASEALADLAALGATAGQRKAREQPQPDAVENPESGTNPD